MNIIESMITPVSRIMKLAMSHPGSECSFDIYVDEQ